MSKANNSIFSFININMKNLTPEMVAYLGTSLAVELSKCKSIEELNVIRNLASQVAATLFTIISQRALLEKEATNQNKTDKSKNSTSDTDKQKQ